MVVILILRGRTFLIEQIDRKEKKKKTNRQVIY